ncbi:hypothetical protein ES319_A02G152300v1 [Gossypium barbadense]|uniref:NAD(P)H-quinone oxidoreductase subunit 5, chloroplastic n=1 Tax=Gossypium barbadense TaxID=3634 RepID=A0A5J5WSU3_GOSBA|nr:hypothetical protein ES319_A02G152300v1 [Gossypium barbadense]
MEHADQYSWIIPFVPLPIPILIGMGLLLFPTATKNLRLMIFSLDLSIQQINGSSIYQYFGYFIDSLTSIMSILITIVGIFVLIYSDNYMSHDEGYLRFFAYMSLFNTSMLGLVTSFGMCSYLLIGFWFTRPAAANACQKAFVTNRIGDFGLLLGILDLFEIFNNLIYNNEVHFLFVILCASLLFAGVVAKSAQFPLHVWLPDAMEGPTPISALIHAATMVAAGIFLVARLLPLFIVIPYIMNLISLIALAQNDIKRGLAYSTMSQLCYMMLALGMGSYRAALFHLITHAYSKALLFLASGSIIHSMETIVGYSPEKSQNMVFMGGLRKHLPVTQIAFLVDEILSDSWLYSPIFATIAWSTAGLTAFYMFRIYLLTFEGHLNVHFQKYSGKKPYTIGGKKEARITITNFGYKKAFSYPHESDNTMLFLSIACFGIFTAFLLYKPFYSSVQNLNLLNSFVKRGPKRILLDKMIYLIYDWSYNRGYIDMFYSISLTKVYVFIFLVISYFILF